MWRLETAFDLTEKAAAALYGQYTFGMNLFNLPTSLARPLTISLIPAVSAAIIQHNSSRAKRIIGSSFRITAMLALPAGVGMSVLAAPILRLLYPAVPKTAEAATYHLEILGFASVFVCIMLLCNAILQACGHVNIPIATALIGGVTKLVVNYILCGDPNFGIKGAPIGTLVCYVIIAALDLIFVAIYVKDRPSYASVFAKPLVATAVMAAAAVASFDFLHAYVHMHSAAAVLGAILVSGAIYCVLVIALRIVTREDMSLLPKGDKIARILHIK
jgi:stage V sporulation protein B